ncbi:uncharacterized protein B0I36DRAFT_384209 [Microdochium trichocladiopsis]|uniref:Uncharacterized protein n=1 Tax=Microdochium trichocladiopsis TaxID=1682393 RepID=A0A9P8Y9V5_9PEZI|nr:uncharacterized protein B0I36DRAFT_384209 [Microdochium trichocladiopsis]KAH7031424.1 hypothetical protein B0I36DRAFT_384209 [Microdochium trichocladiopsis]
MGLVKFIQCSARAAWRAAQQPWATPAAGPINEQEQLVHRINYPESHDIVEEETEDASHARANNCDAAASDKTNSNKFQGGRHSNGQGKEGFYRVSGSHVPRINNSKDSATGRSGGDHNSSEATARRFFEYYEASQRKSRDTNNTNNASNTNNSTGTSTTPPRTSRFIENFEYLEAVPLLDQDNHSSNGLGSAAASAVTSREDGPATATTIAVGATATAKNYTIKQRFRRWLYRQVQECEMRERARRSRPRFGGRYRPVVDMHCRRARQELLDQRRKKRTKKEEEEEEDEGAKSEDGEKEGCSGGVEGFVRRMGEAMYQVTYGQLVMRRRAAGMEKQLAGHVEWARAQWTTRQERQ